MFSPEAPFVLESDTMPMATPEAQRLQTLADLGLLKASHVPIFEEAVQTAAHLLEMPICVLGLLEQGRERLQAAVGLARLGWMNDLARDRQIDREDSLAVSVVEQRQVVAIADASAMPCFANTLLVNRYGIRAYLGVPLIVDKEHCLGALSVMDVAPRNFSQRDQDILQMIARWCMSEFEREQSMLRSRPASLPASPPAVHRATNGTTTPVVHSTTNGTTSSPTSTAGMGTAAVRVNLIAQMTQELRTPLTSILGMASVLNREIYGPLTEKQKKYMDIIHHSGQYLLSLVNEILELGATRDDGQDLRLNPVDIEMLCQQALQSLQEAADRREQQIRLSVEPGHRIWLLDKEKVRQMLYHLVFSVIQASSSESIIRVHVSRKPKRLHLTVWTSHPWLGEGLPQIPDVGEAWTTEPTDAGPGLWEADSVTEALFDETETPLQTHGQSHWEEEWADEVGEELELRPRPPARQNLGVLLCRHLAELHGGQVSLQGTMETGYRYVISLPQMQEVDEMVELGVSY